MGYGLMVYAVDLNAVTSACGSGDDKLRKMISGRFRERIASTNSQLDWSNERGEDSVFEAIRHLIMGDEKMPLPGAMYGYAYKYIVEHHGTVLDNDHFLPAPMSWMMEKVDPQLRALGLGLLVSDLAMAGSPVDFPRPSDFPSFGYWERSSIPRTLRVLKAARLLSPELQQVKGWLETASADKRDLVAFYH